MQKIIGTAAPLSTLHSIDPRIRQGTFDVGEIFIDWLHKTKQHAWQFLPLHQTHLIENNPTEHVPSPYKGYGIGLDPRYLGERAPARQKKKQDRAKFIAAERLWLPEYALFCALRDRFLSDDWTIWDPDIRDRTPGALRYWKKMLSESIDERITEQWRLFRQFDALKTFAKRRNIRFIGDFPYYLPLQSPLVWQYRQFFEMRKNGRMPRVSGVIDGPKAHFGRQVWGHPLYAWKNNAKHRQAITDFFRMRIRHAARLYDILRFDHAKGLYFYSSLDARDPSKDRMRRGPGSSVFDQLILYGRRIGITIFAEDSGDKTTDLRASLDRLHVPGIRLFRFGYEEKKGFLNPRYADILQYPQRVFAYTSSHDTETLFGYLKLLTAEQKRMLANHAGIIYHSDDAVLSKRIRDAIIRSPASHVIIPIQDWLLTEDRINIPGTEKNAGDTNWRYVAHLPIEQFPQNLFIPESAESKRHVGKRIAPLTDI